MVLRRLTLAAGAVQFPSDVTVYGVAKNFAPHELVGGIIQGDSQITVTNAEIEAAQWPGPPKTNDKIIVDGVTRNVQAVESKYLSDEILVHVCQVRG